MNPSIKEIIDLDDLRELMLFFHESAGVSVGVIDAEDNWLVSIGWKDICKNFHHIAPGSRKNCILSDTKIRECLNVKGCLPIPVRMG
jgi:hypothetical protein